MSDFDDLLKQCAFKQTRHDPFQNASCSLVDKIIECYPHLGVENKDIVFKSCQDCIVVLKRTEKTVTNESRYVQFNSCAKFRGNEFIVELIFKKLDPQTVVRSVTNSGYLHKQIKYKTGKFVSVFTFINSEEICAAGIHFFTSLKPAVHYQLALHNPKFTGMQFRWNDDGVVKKVDNYVNGHIVKFINL